MTEQDQIAPWRQRELAGIIVPCDARIAMPHEVTIRSVHKTMMDAKIDFPERVSAINCKTYGFSMVVDDEGRDKRMGWNPRAQFLSGYPIMAPIVGNAIFWSEDFTDDGMDFVSLTKGAATWLLDPQRQHEYHAWRETDEVKDFAAEYLRNYPNPQD